jgi:hypothetical protein
VRYSSSSSPPMQKMIDVSHRMIAINVQSELGGIFWTNNNNVIIIIIMLAGNVKKP